LESPSGTPGVIARMALDVLLFRSLFRHDRVELKGSSQKLIYGGNRYLWVAGLLFHWSLLIILLRHLRLFIEPVPSFVSLLQSVDGAFQIGLPEVYITDVLILAALTYLLLRRAANAQVRYISLPQDYFALFVILAIVITGVLVRHFYRTDLIELKGLAAGLATFAPLIPKQTSLLFYIHLFLVSSLFAVFPWTKLMHMGGVFLSPTRNLANNSRDERHINPWNYPVKVHTYEEWEDEFREAMKEVGLPVEKEQ
jgi:nitrate reductase gamma subunit